MYKAGNIVYVLLICLIVKLGLSLIVPLGIDESYYLLYGRYFDWHFYDHPFMTGLVLKFFAGLVKLNHPFFYRLPFILASIVATYFVYLTGKFLKNSLTGWIACLLFTASPYMFIIAGLFTLPDPLMMSCWTIALYFAARFFLDDNLSQKVKIEFLFWFAVFSGLAMASKIHALLLWVSCFGYALFFQPQNLRKGFFWICFFLSLTAWIPMIVWNVENNWLHFAFYNSRVGTSGGIQFGYLARELAGEIIYQNPIVWLSVFYFVFKGIRKYTLRDKYFFLLFFSLPLLFLIWMVSLFRETLPHWTGPAYIALILLAAMIMVEDLQRLRFVAKIPALAIAFASILVVLAVTLIYAYPGTIGKKNDERHYGQHDFTLDMYGWKQSGKVIASKIMERGLQSTPIYFDNWFPGAQIDEYVASKSGNPVFGVGDITRIHQYHWINQKKGGIPFGDSALYISVSNYPIDPILIYGKRFSTIECIDSVPEMRNGQLTRFFHLYLMRNRK